MTVFDVIWDTLQETVSGIEIIWTAIAIGILWWFAPRCVRHYRRYRALQGKGNPGLEEVTLTQAHTHAIFTLIGWCYLLVGLATMLQPEPPGTKLTPGTLSLTGTLIFTAILMIFWGFLVGQHMKVLAHLHERREKPEPEQ